MKKIEVDERIQADEALHSRVLAAVSELERILGRSAPVVSARFDQVEDNDRRQLIRLTLSDFTGDVVADFAPGELTDDSQMDDRLHRLWGDLLQVRSAKQVEKLNELVKGLGD
ncbi:MAG: hypothetical protein WDZ59_14715 [Pirellulales bacterium]